MPNRILKESICTSDEIDSLSAFHETVFYRLIVTCDDFGRMDARPKILASKLFPLKDIRAAQIEDALRALTSAELVTLYTVDGKPFLQMNTWERHQRLRAKKSRYPAMDSGALTDDGHMSVKCQSNDGQMSDTRPLESEYESESENESESESESETDTEKTRVNAREERFARFWAAYPRKTGKGEARKVFEKINPSESLTERMIAAVQAQAQSSQWRREGGQFIPHPATWLRQGRWEDEPDNTGDGAPRNLFAEYALALEAEGGVL